jgi:hypothetical protein
MVSLSQLIDQKSKFFQCFKYSGKSTGLGKNRDRSEESFELLPTRLALGTLAE